MVVGLAVVAGIAADKIFPGWGRVSLLTSLVFGAIIGIWRGLWRYGWFWTTVLLLLAVHWIVLLKITGSRMFLEDTNPVVVFLIGFVEMMAVAGVLGIVARIARVNLDEM